MDEVREDIAALAQSVAEYEGSRQVTVESEDEETHFTSEVYDPNGELDRTEADFADAEPLTEFEVCT